MTPLAAALPRHTGAALLLLAVAVTTSGCAVSTSTFTTPKSITCAYLPKEVSAIRSKGIFGHPTWEIRLKPGPYISEYEDEHGTYYRGPPSSYSVGQLELPESFNLQGSAVIFEGQFEGGFYIPRDGADTAPLAYHYQGTTAHFAEPPPDPLDCSNTFFSRDSVNHKVEFVTAAVGGAAAGIGAKAIAGGSSVSYGHAAAGGLVAGVLIGAIIQGEIGKVWVQQSYIQKSPDFDSTIRAAVQSAVVIEEVAPVAKPVASSTPAGSPGAEKK